jgi:hypothetical protein
MLPQLRALFQEQPLDAVLFLICILFILTTFVADITAVLGVDLVHFDVTRTSPPLWPPLFVLDALVRYGRFCDLLFLHNPPWYRAAMFGDIFVLGTYYVTAAYALLARKRWIRLPTFIYASHALTLAPLFMVEQVNGPLASPAPAVVLAFYAPYWLFAALMMWRMRHSDPFAGSLNGKIAFTTSAKPAAVAWLTQKERGIEGRAS